MVDWGWYLALIWNFAVNEVNLKNMKFSPQNV